MTYISKRKPRAKQQEALDKCRGREAFALLMAMRVGKTKVVVDEFGEGVTNGILLDIGVIAPAGVYKTWDEALRLDLPDEVMHDLKIWLWQSKDKSRTKSFELHDFLKYEGPRALIMNVEALSSVDRAREAMRTFLTRGKNYLAIDESTTIKNHSSERTKFINRHLRPLAGVRRILSGLPTPRSPLDLYSQFEFLDNRILGQRSYYSFRARYAVIVSMNFGGRSVPVVTGYRDEEELQRRIAPYSFRVRLEDCYDLPPSEYTIREVTLTEKQEKMYAEMRAFATAAISATEHVTATVVIAQIIRLHQILCGHTRDEAGVFHAIPENRTKVLLDILNEYDGKAIIWCAYDHDVRKISEAIERNFLKESERFSDDGFRYVARFWGGNVNSREDEELKFKTDPDCRFMVATASAGGRGRTWDVANLVIYYSSTNDLEHRSQSEERPKGVDKTVPIQYIDLMVPGTVDEKFVKALRNKIDMAAKITGDNYKEWLI